MLQHLLVRVVDPERPDGGIVTHLDGIPWIETYVRYGEIGNKERFGFNGELFGLKEPMWKIRQELDKLFLPIIGPEDNPKWLRDSARTQDERQKLSKIQGEVFAKYLYPQDLPAVLKRLQTFKWRVTTESVVTQLGSTETWVKLVHNEFSLQQRTSAPRSYKTITMTRD
jgi:hypothetical protein